MFKTCSWVKWWFPISGLTLTGPTAADRKHLLDPQFPWQLQGNQSMEAPASHLTGDTDLTHGLRAKKSITPRLGISSPYFSVQSLRRAQWFPGDFAEQHFHTKGCFQKTNIASCSLFPSKSVKTVACHFSLPQLPAALYRQFPNKTLAYFILYLYLLLRGPKLAEWMALQCQVKTKQKTHLMSSAPHFCWPINQLKRSPIAGSWQYGPAPKASSNCSIYS